MSVKNDIRETIYVAPVQSPDWSNFVAVNKCGIVWVKWIAGHIQLLLVFSTHIFFFSYQVVLWKQESFLVRLNPRATAGPAGL
jgi:hypothetical protein